MQVTIVYREDKNKVGKSALYIGTEDDLGE